MIVRFNEETLETEFAFAAHAQGRRKRTRVVGAWGHGTTAASVRFYTGPAATPWYRFGTAEFWRHLARMYAPSDVIDYLEREGADRLRDWRHRSGFVKGRR